MIDAGLLVPMYYDADGDGSGAPGCMRMVCPGTLGFVSNGNDCDDTNPEISKRRRYRTWRATSCTSGKCVSQPNGTGLCL